LARAGLYRYRRLEDDLPPAAGRRPGPALYPGRHDVCACLVVAEPAVVGFADSLDQSRLRRLGQVYDRVGRFVGKVDVVVPGEQRRLSARIAMAASTTVGCLDVVPQVELERLHVLCRRRGT